ncbi:MAG TPA: selenocysteine-specific translation elongation factor [Gemmatimonadales bacterium]|nr:selenocysteine-specific translation elongation factor [Gemmatimonadales bacterium]
MIIGTAGHIDHGKSSLVTALTGRAMDRLAEERRRGITIDLNFAPLELGSGRVAGIVDVPGHEDFVRTMVAGASGIDLALLVVAADEGIMPQTTEHLAVLEHLGVPVGIPVVTKADLVDPEWLELVLLEVSERLAGSPVAFGPPIAVSARTGQGLPELRERIAAQTASVRPSGDLFRLPVDRAFSVAGVGTVVTGTSWSGRVEVGDAVVLLPDGVEGRVRSVEMFGHPSGQSEPGARTAVGIAGITRDAVHRGPVLVRAGDPWQSTSALDVELSLDASAPRALTPRTRVRVHLGTAEILARVHPRSAIGPGGRGLARLALEAPVAARGNDRLVIRSYSPVTTIGGGVVLDPLPPARRAAWPAGLSASTPGERLHALLSRRPAGVAQDALPLLLGIPPKAAAAVARELRGARETGGIWVLDDVVRAFGTKALEQVRRFHRAQPSERGMPLETLRHTLRAPEPVVEAALGDLTRAGKIRQRDGIVALAGFTPKVEGGDAEVDRIVGILEQAALSPPSLAELEAATGRRDLGSLLRLAAASGRVEAVERDRYYTRSALDRFAQTLAELGQDADIVPSAVRERLGISRKYLIPLLEWADGKGLTVRVGDVRRLRVTRKSP